MSVVDALRHPIIQAPLAGGPNTPELAAAVSNAGGLGTLAAGYLTAERLREDISRYRELSSRPFAVNIFCIGEAPVHQTQIADFAARLRAEGYELGEPRFDDDGYDEKLEIVARASAPIVSFTFGCPSTAVVGRLHTAGAAVWVTVTEPPEALRAAQAGADALVVQGVEAGGHRGSFQDTDGVGELGLLPLLALVAATTQLPLIATGGIADGAGVAAVLAAGARAAQLGTAFLLSPEAGTNAAQRKVLGERRPTGLTRAFTGRRARGIVNRFQAEHSAFAPSAYPQVNHLTSVLRRAAREAGNAEAFNLWAGQAYQLAREEPAGELVARLAADARAALRDALSRLEHG